VKKRDKVFQSSSKQSADIHTAVNMNDRAADDDAPALI